MYFSYRLTDAQRRYSIGEKETLAIVQCLADCTELILPSPHTTLVYTDHHNLLKTFGADSANRGRVSVWLDRLGAYDFAVQHRPNTSRVIRVADGLSRLTGPVGRDPVRFDAESPEFVFGHTCIVVRTEDR